MESSDAVFAGSVPENYEQYTVPMFFAPFAADIADRVAQLAPDSVLETAAGTGAVTRQLAGVLPEATRIVATDLNEGMLAQAQLVEITRPVEWLVADALQLPFDDDTFDVVVCQFGVMFFPDGVRGFSEARRVLAPGGTFIFNAWDSIEHNDFAMAVSAACEAMLPDDPPRFLERTPFGYSDEAQIRADLAAAGFVDDITIVTETRRSIAPDAVTAALSFVEGTPLRGEIESRKSGSLAEATTAAAAEFVARFGEGAVEGSMQALVVTASRSGDAGGNVT
ncbi:methyltransferase domain-containing protein [Salinibacterium sp. G-O1]|uniref:class I SAM-dependent methyltransferase n=1 Tax=Salinibacterium sp. G-O1 TaxID=3046208 RepID=UPI0024BB17D2|nr:class I SAM-dependent methyltransferase [Salinibacterium sp. G-O1]MDJ0335964.1 methyltransferase domain-containing protein [Salinibacterium sp. G-O1]